MVEKLIPALSVSGVFSDSFVMGSLDIRDAYLQVPQSNRRRVKNVMVLEGGLISSLHS